MPSGYYENDMPNCGICGRKLRPLYKNKDWKSRAYHVTCWKNMVNDIANYNRVAYSKYGHVKRVADMPLEEAKKQDKFVVEFD